eukprot:1864201-Amphidinium_carterae.1
MSKAEVSGGATASENDAFMQTLAPVRTFMGSITLSEEVCLTYGLRVDFKEEMRRKKEVTNKVIASMSDNAIEGRNFKAAFTVKCEDVKTWRMWKKWLGIQPGIHQKPDADSYERQLKYILMNQQSQDSGRGSHVDADNKVIIGDQAIPRGFSLTHIYSFERAEHKILYQIDVGGSLWTDDAKAPTSAEEELEKLQNFVEMLEQSVSWSGQNLEGEDDSGKKSK